MKNERLEILRKVADRELTPEQADEQLLGLSIVSNSTSCKLGQELCKCQGRLYSEFQKNRCEYYY